MMLTTISSNPSSIATTGSLFLFTLIRSSFSSLDSTIPTPFHSCSFVPLRSNLQPPQLFHFVPLPSSLLHTQQTNLSRFHHIRQAPSFSRHRPNIQTAHSHAVTVHIPHKNDIYGDYVFSASKRKSRRKWFSFIYRVDYGSIQNRANRTVCYGPSFIGQIWKVFTWYGTKTGRNCKPAAIANRPFSLTQRISSQWPRFNQLRCHGLRVYAVCVCNTVRLGQDTTWNRRVHGLSVYPVCVCVIRSG